MHYTSKHKNSEQPIHHELRQFCNLHYKYDAGPQWLMVSFHFLAVVPLLPCSFILKSAGFAMPSYTQCARHFRVQLRKAAIEWAEITGKTNNTQHNYSKRETRSKIIKRVSFRISRTAHMYHQLVLVAAMLTGKKRLIFLRL